MYVITVIVCPCTHWHDQKTNQYNNPNKLVDAYNSTPKYDSILTSFSNNFTLIWYNLTSNYVRSCTVLNDWVYTLTWSKNQQKINKKSFRVNNVDAYTFVDAYISTPKNNWNILIWCSNNLIIIWYNFLTSNLIIFKVTCRVLTNNSCIWFCYPE